MIPALAVALALAGCDRAAAPAETASAIAAAVPVDLNFLVDAGVPAGAALWLHPTDAARSLVIGAVAESGLVLFGMDGKPQARVSGDFNAVAVAYGFNAGAGAGALLLAHDVDAAGLRGYVVDPATLKPTELTAAPLPIRDELTGLCLYHSPQTGKQYAFTTTDGGELQQWELYMERGKLAGRIARSIPVGKGAGYCAVDEVADAVYVADENVGIWRIAAEPERDPGRELLVQIAPRGALGAEAKGIAVYRDAGASYLLAADEAAAAVHLYALPDAKPLGRFQLGGITDPKIEALWAGGFAAAPHAAGVLLIPDEKGGGAAFRLVAWQAVADALTLPVAASVDPRAAATASALTVQPVVETEPVANYGDAADDPAIWIHPRDPAKSLIIGAQKKLGLEVYDLTGRRVQTLPVGRINNVDLRQGVELGGRRRDIVAGSNRTSKTLDLFEVNAATGRLANAVAAPIPTGFGDPYGLCMYHSASSGKLYVFINDPDEGDVRQWEIEAAGDKLGAKLVREFTVGTQAEGCAADDETGALYVAEEDLGLWRYGAEPAAGSERRQLDSTAEGGHLTPDVEGVGIFHGRDGAGYLVVSNQGADNYAVYRREGDNAFIGHFAIVANDVLGIDGASETDGLDVTSAAVGKAFPQGLLVVQDGRNITPAEKQNFKLVPWERVAAALGL
jgi:3-phytase